MLKKNLIIALLILHIYHNPYDLYQALDINKSILPVKSKSYKRDFTHKSFNSSFCEEIIVMHLIDGIFNRFGGTWWLLKCGCYSV